MNEWMEYKQSQTLLKQRYIKVDHVNCLQISNYQNSFETHVENKPAGVDVATGGHC